MSRNQIPRPTLKPGPDVLTIDKMGAAIGQLEGAILLWFHEASPVAIHGLAAAAHDCFQCLCKHADKERYYQTWLDSLSKADQDRERYFQNFIKHGFKDLTGTADFSPRHGEALICASVWCYQNLFQSRSPLIALFHGRFALEHPGFLEEGFLTPNFAENASQQVNRLNRREFLEKYLQAFIDYAATGPPPPPL